MEEAERGLDEQLRASYATGSIFSVCAAVSEIARLRGLQGRRRDGQALLEEFDALAGRRHARGSGPIAKAYAVLAEFKRERGDLDEALRIAEKAAKDVDAWGLPSDVYMTHQYLARVLRSCGKVEQAREEMEKVRLLPQRALVWATLLPSFEADWVKVLLAAGDIASAEAWIREYNPGKAATTVNRETELVAMARVHLAAGGTDEGLADLSRLLDDLACSARAGGALVPSSRSFSSRHGPGPRVPTRRQPSVPWTRPCGSRSRRDTSASSWRKDRRCGSCSAAVRSWRCGAAGRSRNTRAACSLHFAT